MERFCLKNKNRYSCFFETLLSVNFCATADDEIVKVELEETENDPEYYGWKDQKGNITFIFPNKLLLETCFPYGTEAEIKRGNGTIVKLRMIRELENNHDDYEIEI